MRLLVHAHLHAQLDSFTTGLIMERHDVHATAELPISSKAIIELSAEDDSKVHELERS